jgi:rubrerythrin
MNEEQALARAIGEEEWFREFYAKAAEQAEIGSAQQLLLRLAAEEQMHKEKLHGLDTSKLPDHELHDAVIAEELMLTPISEFNNLKDIFSYAIESERKAQKRYVALANTVQDKDAQKLLDWLVGEEKGHEKLLKTELSKLDI